MVLLLAPFVLSKVKNMSRAEETLRRARGGKSTLRALLFNTVNKQYCVTILLFNSAVLNRLGNADQKLRPCGPSTGRPKTRSDIRFCEFGVNLVKKAEEFASTTARTQRGKKRGYSFR